MNPLALDELSELGERHQFLESQVEDVRTARRELHHVIRTLDEEIMHVFDSAFADVNEHFSTLVSSLFPGGTGRLSLTDPGNLLDTGVEVEVRPAGRNVRRLSLLSGGERSLVAMAYLFAVFRSRPSPFYLMDEVEAALDDANLQRFLALVDDFRDEAQLIIVSHQKRTMEVADALYGVTMAPGGSSKVVSQKVPRHRGDGLDWSDGDGHDGPGTGSGGWPRLRQFLLGGGDGARRHAGRGRDADDRGRPDPTSGPCPIPVPELSTGVPKLCPRPTPESRLVPRSGRRRQAGLGPNRSEVRAGAGRCCRCRSPPGRGVPQHGSAQQTPCDQQPVP